VGVAALDQSLALRGAFFSWRVVGAPTVSRTSLQGVGAGHPKLALTIAAGRGAPALEAVTLGLPAGLSFASPGGKVTVIGAAGKRLGFSSRVVGGLLRITLAKAAPQIRVTISYAAIRAGSHLVADVRRHHAPALKVTIKTTDAQHHGAALSTRIRPRG
jgi:hypothetical protein